MNDNALQWWPDIWGNYRKLGNAFWLFVYILTRMDENTGTWKGCYTHIVREIGVSERTVRRWVRSLERCGYIERELTNGVFVIRVKGVVAPLEPEAKPEEEAIAGEEDVDV